MCDPLFDICSFQCSELSCLAAHFVGAITEMGNVTFQLLTRKGCGKVYLLAVSIHAGSLMILLCSAGEQQAIYL